jgi:hypothetical protein
MWTAPPAKACEGEEDVWRAVEPRIGKTRVIQSAKQRVVLIGTRSANSIRAHHHRPDDTGGLVGQCDRGNFGRLARQQSADPLAVRPPTGQNGVDLIALEADQIEVETGELGRWSPPPPLATGAPQRRYEIAPVPRALPSAVPGDCGRCRRPGLGISTTIPWSVRTIFPVGLCTRPLSFGVSRTACFEASATRSPCSPITRNRGSTTAVGSLPIRHVHEARQVRFAPDSRHCQLNDVEVSFSAPLG